MYNNRRPIVPGFGTSQVRPEYSPKYFQRILKRCGIPGFTCQTHSGDLLGFLAHAVKMTLRAGMFTPMAKVSVANRIFLHLQCRTFHRQDKKVRKNHGKTPLPKVWWGSILKQIEIEVQLALNWQSWHKPSGEHDLNCLARRKRASVAEAMRFKKKPLPVYLVIPEKMQHVKVGLLFLAATITLHLTILQSCIMKP